jgi:hypothetical protein
LEDAQPVPAGFPGPANGEERRAAKGLWQRVRERFTSKGPHAPGVWIVYFSLAALPLFAIGEAFLPDDPERRRHAFHLLFLYVASGLSLLMTTSFLGLRRYLRQRNVQMPSTMAGWWMAFGSAIVVALVLVAAILPRPSGDDSRSNIRLVFDSADHEASEYAMGSDGAKGEGAPGGTQKQNQPQGAGSGTSAEQGADGQSKQEGRSGGTSSSQSGQSSPGSRGQSAGQSADQGEKSAKGAGSESRGSESQGERQSGEQSEDGKQEATRPDQGNRELQESGGGQRESKRPASKRDGGQGRKSREPSRSQSGGEQQDESSDRGESRSGKSNDQQAEQREQQAAEAMPEGEQRGEDRGAGPSDSASPPPESRPSRSLLPRIELGSGWWATLLRWLLYAALAGIALVWAWRNREMVAAAFRDMLQVLRDLWSRLFGGSRAEPQPAEPEQATPAPPPPPRFSAYTDPFATGTADRMAPDELVRYTFEATEAWARDCGCPREPDQTPHEFARMLAARAPQLAGGVRRLAELYSQAAYAPGTLPARRVMILRELWHDLGTVRAGL